MTERQSNTHEKILSLVNLLPQLYQDTLGFLLPDSLQILTLEQLAESDYDFPGAWARNILIASGLINYEEPLVGETTLKSSRKDRYHWTNTRSITSVMKVFPNPAKDFVIVEYRKNGNMDQAVLLLLDTQGRKIRSFLLRKKENQQIIPLEGLSPGNYLIQLQVNGSLKESSKVVILR